MSATFTSGVAVSSKVSGKHNGKAIVDGQQTELDDVATTPPADTVAMTDSPAENTEIKPRDYQAEFSAAMERSARAVGRLMDATALTVYCEVGDSCLDTLRLGKAMYDDIATRARANSEWSADLHDDICHQLGVKVAALFPHLFAANKAANDEREAKGKRRDPIHVQDYILVTMAVQSLRPIVGDGIERLSYRLLLNYIARNVVAYSKAKLTCTLRDGWAEWIKINLGRLISGEITVGNVIAAMKEHADRLTQAKTDKRFVGKTDTEVAAIKADDERKKNEREATARTKRVETDLATSLYDAMSGAVTPSAIVAAIHQIAADTGCDLGLSPDPKTVSVDAVLMIFRGMFTHARYNDLRALHKALAATVALVDAYDPPKPITLAATA